jgi:FtsH-binding integral membrane protein
MTNNIVIFTSILMLSSVITVLVTDLIHVERAALILSVLSCAIMTGTILWDFYNLFRYPK